MFPDQLFYIQGRGTKNKTPTIPAVLVVEGIVNNVEARPRQREPNGEQPLKFRRIKLGVGHAVELVSESI